MLRFLIARAVQRGLWEGSRGWIVVGVLAGLARLVQKDDEQEVVFSQRLEPGRSLTVTVRGGR